MSNVTYVRYRAQGNLAVPDQRSWVAAASIAPIPARLNLSKPLTYQELKLRLVFLKTLRSPEEMNGRKSEQDGLLREVHATQQFQKTRIGAEAVKGRVHFEK
jgi:hypothetical protein